ncbi:MAG: hypothetical protein MRJ67_01725 [Nitrospirales bacterium]|nr:hypothetical protein [Nitrospira sp.]MDR4459229.1 hypothetical protein [Nitrospirales bacterium]
MLTQSTMRRTTPGQFLAGLMLSMCFLLMTGGIAYTAPLHIHHGHHDQHTHGNSWCSWTCQAGQGLQTLSTDIPRTFSLLGLLPPFKPTAPDLCRHYHHPSRAPPLFLQPRFII